MQTQTLRQWITSAQYGGVTVTEVNPGYGWQVTVHNINAGVDTVVTVGREQATGLIQMLAAALETLPPPLCGQAYTVAGSRR
jgi:hypothetical protein